MRWTGSGSDRWKAALVVTATAAGLMAVLASARGMIRKPAAGAGPPAGEQIPGVETCGKCHAEAAAGWAGSAHARQAVTCPICHGPAPDHVRSGGRARDVRVPRRLPYEAGVYLCGRCHDLRQFRRSRHYQFKLLDCFSCHRAHACAPAEGAVTFCGTTGCHPDIARGLQGHRTRLARVTCAGCHLPVTTDWRSRQSGTNHTLRPALAREALSALGRGRLP